MANFETALERTLKFEGGYSNDPRDGGGETFCGISRKAWPKWEGWEYVDNRGKQSPSVQSLINSYKELNGMVSDFYRVNFWLPIHGDEIESQEIANALFDFAVNSGVPTAVKALQEEINAIEKEIGTSWVLDTDGIIGSMTLKCLLRYNSFEGEKYVCSRLRNARLIHICRWVAAKPERHKFLKGLAERAVKA